MKGMGMKEGKDRLYARIEIDVFVLVFDWARSVFGNSLR